jgi:hypothetical protein
MGSAGFLLIFAAVNAANVKLAEETGSRRWLSLTGVFLCLAALVSLFWQTAISSAGQLWVPLLMTGLAFIIEVAFRATTGRTIRIPKSRGTHENL